MKPRFAGLAAGVLSLVLVVLSSHGWAGEGTVAAPANPALAAALESVHPEAIRADLYFIASDELAGRDTPSLGLRVAARFLRARLERLGLQPGGPNGSYFAPFALEKNALDIDACKIEFGGKTYELGKDYFLSAFGGVSARDLLAPIVYAGELKAEELEQIDASGKWLLVLERDSEMRLLGRLGEVAAKKPAGLIVVPAAGYVGKPYAERFASWMERLKEPRLAPVTSANKASEGSTRQRSRGSVNTVYLPAETKDALFAAAHVEEAQLKIGTQLALDFKEVRAVLPNPEHVDVENVCGFWPGNDPVLKNDVIMVTAHYDHVGVNKAGEIFNGADDNGSGTCGLLALAEMLTKYGPMRRSVMIMWVAGEEKGLWGSAAWTRNPTLPEGYKAVADINIDMIGRNAPEKLTVTPSAEHESYNFLSKLAVKLSPEEGFPTLDSADQYYTRSDHYNFVQAGIPATFLFAGVHEDYHRPTDDPEKIDYDKIRRVVRLVFRMLADLQNDSMG